MSITETKYEHIVIDNGVPIISGTTMKVIELVAENIAFGWSPEEIHFQHPYLTLGQIHSAMAYYWDHAEELGHEIERHLKNVGKLKQILEPSSLTAKLKSKGLL